MTRGVRGTLTSVTLLATSFIVSSIRAQRVAERDDRESSSA
jgi:hypothetical protein